MKYLPLASRRAALVFVLTVLPGGRADAALIWYADATRTPAQIFKNLEGDGNCGAGFGTITALDDPEHKNVFRYDKPASSRRCENHGLRLPDGMPYVFQNDATYYLGWWSKLSSTGNNNANFQWKSYENHQQNFPVVLKMIGGQMSLMYTPPGGGSSIIWRKPITASTWHHFVLGIKTSNAIRGGTIELWLDGMKQMLAGGMDSYAARTWDSGNHNCPKWGVYGGQGSTMSNTVAEQKVGTTYDDVAMGSPTPGSGVVPADGGAEPAPDAQATPDVNAADTAGAGGTGGSATTGVAGKGGVADAAPAAGGQGGAEPEPETPPAPDRRSGQGGCRMAGGPEGGAAWLVIAGLALWLARRFAWRARFRRS